MINKRLMKSFKRIGENTFHTNVTKLSEKCHQRKEELDLCCEP